MSDRVWIIWRGQRDYEENLVVCETEERAHRYLADHGVMRRPDWTGYVMLMDKDGTPWGIEECELLR